MFDWIQSVFNSPEFGLLVLPASLLLGLISSFACLGCCAPLVVAIIGFAGSRESNQRRDTFIIAGFFLLGSVLAFSAVGWLAGFVGQAAQSAFGFYGKIVVAILAIILGFIALDLLPFRIPSVKAVPGKLPAGAPGAALFGLAVGVISVTYTMGCCGTLLLPVVLGVTALKGQAGWGAVILAMFAVGYSLPFVALTLGIGLGKAVGFMKRISGPVQKVSGAILIVAGFWLLFTL
jgi:cytochrome c-type biogenesis protein